MLPEILQDRAAAYVTGSLPATERQDFELVLAFHVELQRHVAELQDAASAAIVAGRQIAAAPAALRGRLLAALAQAPAPDPAPVPEPMVVTDPLGRVQWVNAPFEAMCGHSLAELRGRKPGTVLQGRDTDPAAVNRIREAVRARARCRETLVNYHKDGSPYRVDVRITPILDEACEPLWFIAQETKLPV